MKLDERRSAIALRRQGWTYDAIKRQLGVSKGTLSSWLRHVPYTPTEGTRVRRRLASIAAGLVLHHRKLARTTAIQREAEQSLPEVDRDMLHLLGVMAYWTEGSKTQDGIVAFTNTDPSLIRLVQRWWMECCGVDPNRLRLHIRVHHDTVREDAEAYWRGVTGIPESQCEKTTIKESGSGGRRIRKIRNGIATIKVCDTNFHYRIAGWIQGLINQLALDGGVSKYEMPPSEGSI